MNHKLKYDHQLGLYFGNPENGTRENVGEVVSEDFAKLIVTKFNHHTQLVEENEALIAALHEKHGWNQKANFEHGCVTVVQTHEFRDLVETREQLVEALKAAKKRVEWLDELLSSENIVPLRSGKELDQITAALAACGESGE